jgi:hypothetical protein
VGYVGLNGKEILNGNETMNFDGGISKFDFRRQKKPVRKRAF